MSIIDRSTVFPLLRHFPAVRRKSRSHRTHGRPHARSWMAQLKQLGRLVVEMTMMSVSVSDEAEPVTPKHTPFSATLAVTPTIAAANTPRVLTITAFFPLGCGPGNAVISGAEVEGRHVLDVCLDAPSPNFAFCDLVLVPYTVELTYTPFEEGDLPVRIFTADGRPVGESVIMTRLARSEDAQFAVTGKWIDISSKEGGLALVPDSPRNSTVVGTWDFHDHEGVSRRYSIESVHWKEQNVEAEGAIFEVGARSGNAPSPDVIPSSTASQLGLARITFHGLNSARIFALGFGGNVLFTSNLVRATGQTI